MRNKVITILTMLAIALAGQNISAKVFKNDEKRWLVFEAEVLQIGKSPGVLCGVVSPYRQAKYKIEKIYRGSYEGDEIIVDHLYCRADVLEDIKIGDKVLVVIDLYHRPAERTNDGLIRRPEDKVKRFYVATRVAVLTNCCNF